MDKGAIYELQKLSKSSPNPLGTAAKVRLFPTHKTLTVHIPKELGDF
jgi:hypothetical protein